MIRRLIYTTIFLSTGFFGGQAVAGQTRVTVTIENLAPVQGTNQTPHWVGFHDGTFDIYNGGTRADSLPVPGDPLKSVENLAEDGNNEPISQTFNSVTNGGVDGTIAGPNGPIAPGEIATDTFVLDSHSSANRYFSYASMLLPSNDFWYANGNPLAHKIFSEDGKFIAQDFIVTNLDVLDAGTEVNDEEPVNTAFFGQQAPNTGVDEGGVIRDFLNDNGDVQLRFQSAANGGILADTRFAMADFAIEGYPLVKISFSAEPVRDIEPPKRFRPVVAGAALSGNQQVPDIVTTAAFGKHRIVVTNNFVKYASVFRNLSDIQMAHLHLGPAGQNGPVIANLIPSDLDLGSKSVQRKLTRALYGKITAENLTGPLAGQPLNVLAREIRRGNVYVNIHTIANPAGELRGQLQARRRK